MFWGFYSSMQINAKIELNEKIYYLGIGLTMSTFAVYQTELYSPWTLRVEDGCHFYLKCCYH